MKNILKFVFASVLVFGFTACEDSNNPIDEVFDYETGAIIRTLNVNNNLLNSSDASSAFSVDIEVQDEEEGALLSSVDALVSLRDLTPDNGTITATDALVNSYDASEFEAGPFGLPRINVSLLYTEMVAAMGLSADDVAPGDILQIELRLNLTDGRTFGRSSAAGIITGGFFSSPFLYNAVVTCTPLPGDYLVEMFDTYGDGWQTNDGNGGDGITVDLNQGETIIEVGLCSPYGAAAGTFLESGAGTGCTENDGYEGEAIVTIPEGTESYTWNFPGDQYGEISFNVYDPNDDLVYAGGIGETGPGLLPILVCL